MTDQGREALLNDIEDRAFKLWQSIRLYRENIDPYNLALQNLERDADALHVAAYDVSKKAEGRDD